MTSLSTCSTYLVLRKTSISRTTISIIYFKDISYLSLWSSQPELLCLLGLIVFLPLKSSGWEVFAQESALTTRSIQVLLSGVNNYRLKGILFAPKTLLLRA